MEKHRNPSQEKIFMDFMESHQDIARGFVKGDRVVTEAHWSDLTKLLNMSGPPTKDCSGWKKTWADWKMYVKKKMCHNKRENEKTGGGKYNKYILTDVEETVASVSGIYRSVEGVTGARSFGELDLSLLDDDSEKENEGEIDVIPSISNYAKENANLATTNNEQRNQSSISSTSKRRRSRTPLPDPKRTPSPDPKRYRPRTPCTPSKPSDLNSLLAEENKHLKNIAKQMEDHRVDIKLDKIALLMEEQRDEMKLQNEKLDRFCGILENHFKASQLNDIETQKILLEKNELKLKLIESETLRLEVDRQNANHR